ncbi:probable transcription factor At1g61730 [Rhodamnia argentea]|uniref:Probable transcription factor At1g61730 n=1 Tax=Rhodamnia argentea TaxID=178133 RepID=A0A8B8NG72_9MYRT|nr:probable transcription factor At1g61730 [Rhodamnia argentea]
MVTSVAPKALLVSSFQFFTPMSNPVKLRMSPRLRTRGRASASPAAAQSNDRHPPTGEQQKPRPDQLFSEEDEIRLLKSLSKLINPLLSPTVDAPTLDGIEKSLGPNFTRAQLSNKIRRLRDKYHRQARTKVLIRTPHDRRVFELARGVWGKRSSKERKGKEEKRANLEEERAKDEGEILGGEEDSEGAAAAADLGNFPALVEECDRCFPGNRVWREGLKRLQEGKLRRMNERVVWLRLEEANLMTKKAELTRDLTRMILESVASASQAPTG